MCTQVFVRLIEKAIVCLEQAPATAHIENRCAGGEAGDGGRERWREEKCSEARTMKLSLLENLDTREHKT